MRRLSLENKNKTENSRQPQGEMVFSTGDTSLRGTGRDGSLPVKSQSFIGEGI